MLDFSTLRNKAVQNFTSISPALPRARSRSSPFQPLQHQRIAWDLDVTDSPATSRPRFPGSGGRPPATFPPISLAAKLPAAKFASLHASACSRPLPCCTFQHVFKALSQLPALSGTSWLRGHLRTSTFFRNQRRGKNTGVSCAQGMHRGLLLQ